MPTHMKHIFLSAIFFTGLSIQNIAIAKIETILGNLPLQNNPNLIVATPTTAASEIILSRDQYVLSYNKYTRSPNWVAWKLEAPQIGTSGRSNIFKEDSELEAYLATSPTLSEKTSTPFQAVKETDYKGSCFDRGHQIPSADRSDSMADNESTFLMSNMAPQTPFLNRVIWEHLEQYTRDLVQQQGKKAYVIAGPIYDEDFGSIGPNHDIQIPSKEFKIIFLLNANEGLQSINKNTPMIAVIMPNILQDGTKPSDNKDELCKPLTASTVDRNDWFKYQTTVLEIERLSGLTFMELR